MSGVKCVACGSIGAILIACSKCKNIIYCKVCEPELKSERVEQRLCEICYQHFIQEEERREEEKKIITVIEESTRLFENLKIKEPKLLEISVLEAYDNTGTYAAVISAVVFTVFGTIFFLRDPNADGAFCSLLLVLVAIYGFFQERKNKAEKLAKLNQIKSNKLFSDYSKKETEKWIYNKVIEELDIGAWYEEEESLELESEKEMIKMTIKKVIKSLE